MVFALDKDDGGLLAFPSAAEAAAHCKGIDVEDGFWRFFAEDGSPLEARFERPSEPGNASVVPAAYTLQRAMSGLWLQERLAQIATVRGCGLATVAELVEMLKINRGKRVTRESTPWNQGRVMHSAFRIEPIDHRALPIAQQLHAVQMNAYAQEAQLLGATHFPPLERTVDEVRTSAEEFLAAFIGDEMVGAVSVWPDREGMGVNIASLVVAPQFQRRGIGKRLLATVLAERGCGELTVQTGAKNLPALTLYAQVGFVEIRRWLVGREPLELVKLRRPAGSNNNAT